MATLLLQAAGAYLGGLFGAVGATVGTAAGALGGYLVDRALINGTQHIKGARLSQVQPLTGEDGAPLARVYGTVRLGGTLIWATRFEEASKTERSGAKGGPKVTTFSYFANFAVAICEGEIAHVRRIWADGRELDQSEYNIRIHKGSAAQLPDPLIEAKQGAGNAPAYRGTAYAVFDRFPLDSFGNRIPQVQFEVIRTLGGIEKDIRAITLIPGSTEFGLSPTPVIQTVRAGETVISNRHALWAGTDWAASLDELQALCPNLESVALVVAWFGNDLRAANCQIRPGVSQAVGFQGDSWQVSGTSRAGAHLVSDHGGKRAFGGTPDDASVSAAIRDLTTRGLKVTLYPFVLMDVPTGNALPSPYGGPSQPAYPWRGDITCTPAPGQPGTVDATVAAASQVAAFSGNALPSHFGASGDTVTWSGGADWGYRRMVLHYAKLAAIAGGVDAFLIGSEFKALTRVRSAVSSYPFVTALQTLAADVRAILGASVKLTYAADWSEYGAYTPPGTNNLDFHLDPLWAHPAINAVGIDNYMPLSDWRDSHADGSNPDGAGSSSDKSALTAAIAGGEGFDWYYASDAARAAGIRTPIIDGLAGKHWVYRTKDLKGWWLNPHYPRIGGVESPTPTAWLPQSKPIWFTELGCPAVDKAANQPNVFPDPKSAASALPWFSDGGRDDLVQNRFVTTHLEHWTNGTANPLSSVYGAPMMDLGNCYLWAWDARPYPAFPVNGDVWGDGANWLTGHWLNGRLSGVTLERLVDSILEEHSVTASDCSQLDGFVSGFVLNGQTTAREALDQLLSIMRVDVSEQGGRLTFRSQSRSVPVARQIADVAFDKHDRLKTETLLQHADVAGEMTLLFRDELRDHQQTTVQSNIANGNLNAANIELPASLDPGLAQAQLRQFHRDMVAQRASVSFQTGWAEAALTPGDLVAFAGNTEIYRVRKLSDGAYREIEAERVASGGRPAARTVLPDIAPYSVGALGQPWYAFLDLPQLMAGDGAGLKVAAWSKPWSPVVAYSSPASDGYTSRATLGEQAIAGNLTSALLTGAMGRWERTQDIDVRLFSGGLSSASEALVLGGANAAAVKSANGQWEILQFERAQEISAGTWRLSGLLRGQLGTNDAASAGAYIGTEFVLLDSAVVSAGLTAAEAELVLNWKIGPAGQDFIDRYFAQATAGPANRARRSYSPAHLKCRDQLDGSKRVEWIRRGLLDGDGWDAAEIALPEGTEAYQIRVLGAGGAVRRSLTANAAPWTYSTAAMLADFGTGPSVATIEISQIGADGMPGITASIITLVQP